MAIVLQLGRRGDSKSSQDRSIGSMEGLSLVINTSLKRPRTDWRSRAHRALTGREKPDLDSDGYFHLVGPADRSPKKSV